MEIDFDKLGGLVPVIVQDASSRVVLMLGYMNQEALDKSITEGRVTFYSRTKQRLWTKGETSGNFLIVKEIKVDCDRDTLLILAQPAGPVCHTGDSTCFGDQSEEKLLFLHRLGEIIRERKENPTAASYTASLFASGLYRIAQKVGEEGVELALEATKADASNIASETADLLFHTLVLLEEKGVSLDQVMDVLQERHRSR